MRSITPLRRGLGRSARVLWIITALVMIGGTAAPAGAAVRVSNLAKGSIGIVNAPATYAYWSGASTSFNNGPAFWRGSFTSTVVDPKQALVESHVAGGAASVAVNNGGADWGSAWAIPGAPAASATSVAVDGNGIVAVALLTAAKEVVVARQAAPGIWSTTPTFVAMGTNAKDVEITYRSNGLLAAATIDATTGRTTVRQETAVGTWGANVDLGGVSARAGIAETAAGLVVMAIGNPANGIYHRAETAPGVWSAWAKACTTPVDAVDVSTFVNGAPQVQSYLATSTGVYSCRWTGAAWELVQVKTGNYSTVSATRLVDWRTLVSATTSTGVLATATADWTGSAASWSAWSAGLATGVSDHEVDAYNAGSDLRLTSTGANTYATSGTWTSPVIDTGGNGVFGLLRWRATAPGGTAVTFQVAASDGDPTNFVGPDGTAATKYVANHPGFAYGDVALPYAFDGLRNLRIRATLTGTGTATPLLHDVTVNYRLDRAPRASGGRAVAVSTSAPVSFVVRTTSTTAATAWFADARSTLAPDTSASWGANALSAAFDSAAPSCCSTPSFGVTGGTVAENAGVPPPAPVGAGANLGQSVVLQRTAIAPGTADFTAHSALSSSLTVDQVVRSPLMSNVGRGGTASESSEEWAGAPGRAIDGNTGGVWDNGSVTHTTKSSEPWWKVDLGASKQLSDIRIWNRTDCCAERLAGMVVLTSNAPIPTASYEQAVAAVYAAGGQVRSVPGLASVTQPFLFAPGTTARYVQVMLRARVAILSLAEVEIFGV